MLSHPTLSKTLLHTRLVRRGGGVKNAVLFCVITKLTVDGQWTPLIQPAQTVEDSGGRFCL